MDAFNDQNHPLEPEKNFFTIINKKETRKKNSQFLLKIEYINTQFDQQRDFQDIMILEDRYSLNKENNDETFIFDVCLLPCHRSIGNVCCG